MKDLLELSSPKDAKLYLIVDIGLASSAMMRLFEKGSVSILRKKLLEGELQRVFSAESEKQYGMIHSDFCKWGMQEIRLAKGGDNASYGQIAKTLDVALKVIVYYCHLPECGKSKRISEWLNAAVDTKMMAELKKQYPKDAESWPTTLKEMNDCTYVSIQATVRKFIDERPDSRLMPVQFDDMLWKKLNRSD